MIKKLKARLYEGEKRLLETLGKVGLVIGAASIKIYLAGLKKLYNEFVNDSNSELSRSDRLDLAYLIEEKYLPWWKRLPSSEDQRTCLPFPRHNFQ